MYARWECLLGHQCSKNQLCLDEVDRSAPVLSVPGHTPCLLGEGFRQRFGEIERIDDPYPLPAVLPYPRYAVAGVAADHLPGLIWAGLGGVGEAGVWEQPEEPGTSRGLRGVAVKGQPRDVPAPAVGPEDHLLHHRHVVHAQPVTQIHQNAGPWFERRLFFASHGELLCM